MKRIESEYAIECYPDYGPQFGDNIYIYDIICLSHCIIHNVVREDMNVILSTNPPYL